MSLSVQEGRELYTIVIPRAVRFVYHYRKGSSLYCARSFHNGEIVLSLGKVYIVSAKKATPAAIQLDGDHFLDSQRYTPSDFINHSCSPNTYIDLQRNAFVAIRPIKKNKEITYHYCTTEWDLQRRGEDFRCRCGSKKCLQYIRGFKYLTQSQKLSLEPWLSPFLKKLIVKKK